MSTVNHLNQAAEARISTDTPSDNENIQNIQQQPERTDSPVPSNSTNSSSENLEAQPEWDEEHLDELPRCLRFLGWFSNVSQSLRSLLYIILGSAILAIPALVDWIFFVDKSNTNGSWFQITSRVNADDVAMFYWSVFLSLCWAVLIAAQYVFLVTPALTLRIIDVCMGKVFAERYRRRLEYVRELHRYISAVCTSLFAVIICAAYFSATGKSGLFVSTVDNIVLCLFLGSVFLCVEKLIVQVAAVNFHEKAYLDRIVQNKFAEFVLERLWDGNRARIRKNRQSKNNWWQISNNSPRSSQPVSPVTVSATKPSKSGFITTLSKDDSNMVYASQSLPNLLKPDEHPSVQSTMPAHSSSVLLNHSLPVITLDVPTTNAPTEPTTPRRRSVLHRSGAFLATGSNYLIKKPFSFVNAMSEASGVKTAVRETSGILSGVTSAALSTIIIGTTGETDIQSYNQARSLAKELFNAMIANAHNDGVKELTAQSFIPHFTSETEANRAFRLFDNNVNGKISSSEMRHATVQYYHDKRSIDKGLRDLSATVGTLDSVLLFITSIIFILACFVVFGYTVSSYIVAAGSMIIAASFVIGNSAKNVFESTLFVFVYHPYDVGDRVDFDNESYTVKEMGLTMTLFHRLDGTEMYCPNTVMAQKKIFNIRRSPPQSDTVSIQLPLFTPPSKLQSLNSKMTEFNLNNSHDFRGNALMIVQDSKDTCTGKSDLKSLNVTFVLAYTINFQDGLARIARRNHFIYALRQAILDLEMLELQQ